MNWEDRSLKLVVEAAKLKKAAIGAAILGVGAFGAKKAVEKNIQDKLTPLQQQVLGMKKPPPISDVRAKK